MGLNTIPDPIVLDVRLAARSCHKSVIIKKKKTKKKTKRKKKINEEKEKKSELTGLTLQTLNSCRESLIIK
jgi:hypothetical protein